MNGLPSVDDWPDMEELDGWDKIDLKLGEDGLEGVGIENVMQDLIDMDGLDLLKVNFLPNQF